jgi:hypothetical protein
MKKINTLTVKLFKKFSSQNNKPYKFGVPIFQKLGGLFLGGLTFPPIFTLEAMYYYKIPKYRNSSSYIQ